MVQRFAQGSITGVDINKAASIIGNLKSIRDQAAVAFKDVLENPTNFIL
jgi:hypothetical protein